MNDIPTGRPLDFQVLSSYDFEQLCLWLVKREGFEDVQHFGGPGDNGCDVSANKDGRQYAFQCKKYQKFGRGDAKKAIETALRIDPRPDVLVLMIACTPSPDALKETSDAFEVLLWGFSELNEMVERRPDVRQEFFPQVRRPDPASLFLAPRRNPNFTGREEIIAELRRRLVEGESAALYQAINGLGGIGKTATAIEYCHRYADEYRHVLWVNASSETELAGDFVEVAVRLDLVDEEAQPEQAIPTLIAWLNTTPGWVLVFDDANEIEVLDSFLPSHPKGHVVVTTRASTIPGFPPPLSVQVLGMNEGMELLARRLRRDLSDDQQAARDLAKALGYLPLALEQAAAYMVTRRVSLASYFDRFQRQRLALVDKQVPDSGYQATVATTWKVSFEAVEHESRAAADVLRVCAFLAPDAIPFELFTRGGEHLGSEIAAQAEALKEEPLELSDLVEPLVRYSLMTVDGADKTLGVHRLVQAVTRAELDDEAQVWQGRAVEGVAAVMPARAHSYEDWPAARRLFNHVQVLVDGEAPLESEAGASMLQGAGGFANSQGWYRLSLDLRRSSLDTRRRVQGEEHPQTLKAMNNLANTFRQLGDFEGARDLHQQTLDIRRRILGEEDPYTLTSMNNLANTLHSLGDFKDARDLQRQTLDIYCRVLGEEHPSTLKSMNNLANTLHTLGDFEGARDLQQRVFDSCRRVLGEEHPDTLMSMNNLANTLHALGDFEGARDLQQQTLDARCRVLGEEHPRTLTSMNNLASTLRHLGDLEGARNLYQKIFDANRRILGEGHPHTLQSQEGLVATLKDT